MHLINSNNLFIFKWYFCHFYYGYLSLKLYLITNKLSNLLDFNQLINNNTICYFQKVIRLNNTSLVTCYPQYLTCDSVFRNQKCDCAVWVHVVFPVIAGSSLQVLADNDRGTWIVLWERRHSHSHCSFSAALQTLYSPNAPALSVSVMFVMCVCGKGLFRDLQPDKDAFGPNKSHLYGWRRWTSGIIASHLWLYETRQQSPFRCKTRLKNSMSVSVKLAHFAHTLVLMLV